VRVAAGSDSAGLEAGHAASWPWYRPAKSQDATKIAETSRYFDTVNFASRIKCPILWALGLIDTTCPPVGALAAYNQIHAPKEIVFMVNSGHGGGGATQVAFWPRQQAWLKALSQNAPAPVK
jgi:cephalosporin-C deacetylase-like acetyl esterase